MKFAWLALALVPTLAAAEGGSFTDFVSENDIPAAVSRGADLSDITSPEELDAEMLMDEQAYRIEDEFMPTAGGVRLHIVVTKRTQSLVAKLDGNVVASWKVSTGTEQRKCAPSRCYIARTPVGTWAPKSMHFNYTSRLWAARMDRAIFFTGGIALHATYGENIDKLGSRASGGCIRQRPDHADQLFRLVKQVGMSATRITVRE